MSATPDNVLMPIGEVERLTGVKSVTLRAWERRYGLLRPQRRESGHRLYTLEDVAAVRKVLAWLDQGIALGNMRALLGTGVAESGVSKADTTKPGRAAQGDSTGRKVKDRHGTASDIGQLRPQQQEALAAVASLQSRRLEQLAGDVSRDHPWRVWVTQWLLPLRDMLLQQSLGLAFFDAVFEQKLQALIMKLNRPLRGVPILVVPTGEGESRIASLVLGMALLESGRRVICLPRAVSNQDIQRAIDEGKVQAVVLVIGPDSRSDALRRASSGSGGGRAWFAIGDPGRPLILDAMAEHAHVDIAEGLDWLLERLDALAATSGAEDRGGEK